MRLMLQEFQTTEPGGIPCRRGHLRDATTPVLLEDSPIYHDARDKSARLSPLANNFVIAKYLAWLDDHSIHPACSPVDVRDSILSIRKEGGESADHLFDAQATCHLSCYLCGQRFGSDRYSASIG